MGDLRHGSGGLENPSWLLDASACMSLGLRAAADLSAPIQLSLPAIEGRWFNDSGEKHQRLIVRLERIASSRGKIALGWAAAARSNWRMSWNGWIAGGNCFYRCGFAVCQWLPGCLRVEARWWSSCSREPGPSGAGAASENRVGLLNRLIASNRRWYRPVTALNSVQLDWHAQRPARGRPIAGRQEG